MKIHSNGSVEPSDASDVSRAVRLVDVVVELVLPKGSDTLDVEIGTRAMLAEQLIG